MLVRRRSGSCPLVDLGSVNPPAKRVRRDTKLLPDPRTPPPATGIIMRIKHKTHRTPTKLFSDIYVVLLLVLIHFRGIKNLHQTRGNSGHVKLSPNRAADPYVKQRSRTRNPTAHGASPRRGDLLHLGLPLGSQNAAHFPHRLRVGMREGMTLADLGRGFPQEVPIEEYMVSKQKKDESSGFPWIAMVAILIAFSGNLRVGIALCMLLVCGSLVWMKVRSMILVRHVRRLESIRTKRENEQIVIEALKRL